MNIWLLYPFSFIKTFRKLCKWFVCFLNLTDRKHHEFHYTTGLKTNLKIHIIRKVCGSFILFKSKRKSKMFAVPA